MEVAIALGADPATIFSSVAPLPMGIDEMLFSGFLRDRPVEMAPCATVDLRVPAHSEIVLEGYVDPDERRTEGPFGDHTGYYSLADCYPVFHVTALTRKRRPIFPATIVGAPPMEDCYMGKAIERIFLPLLRTQWPEIADMNLPWEGVFHNNACLTMEKDYPLQARRLMSGLWGAGQMSLTKSFIIGDPGDPVDRPAEFLLTALDRLMIPDSIYLAEGIMDELDHSAPQPLWGSKVGIDATTPVPNEKGYGLPPRSRIPAPTESTALEAALSVSPDVRKVLIPFAESVNPVLVIWFEKRQPGATRKLAQALIESKALSKFRIFVLMEAETEFPMTGAQAALRLCNNTDPARDFIFLGDRLGIDATKKWKEEGFTRPWPPDIVMSREVREHVDAKWPALWKRWETLKGKNG